MKTILCAALWVSCWLMKIWLVIVLLNSILIPAGCLLLALLFHFL